MKKILLLFPIISFIDFAFTEFTTITTGDIVNDAGNSYSASWADYNNDGFIDLFVTNYSNQDNFLYLNNGQEYLSCLLTSGEGAQTNQLRRKIRGNQGNVP